MYQLTKDDLIALRTAESICFHFFDKAGKIVARIEAPYGAARYYTATEQRAFPNVGQRERTRDIEVDASVSGLDDRDLRWSLATDPGASAYASISYTSHDDAWQTITALLRAGDALRLVWVASDNTEALREGGMVRDTLSLVVERGDKRLTFNLKQYAGPDHSGRMVKRFGD